jgi:hypothetical protein
MSVVELAQLVAMLLDFTERVATNQATARDAVALAHEVAQTLLARLKAREVNDELTDIPY